MEKRVEKKWDPGEVSRGSKFIAIMRLIRVEHTLYSLPFAYIGILIYDQIPTIREAILIAIALFGLRAAAMSFNNIADYDIDKYNPRTSNRPLIRRDVSLSEAWLVVVAGLVIYFVASYLLNMVALILSPLPMLIVLTYPYSKRIHSFPHIHLGLSLGIVPIAGYIATFGDEYGVVEVLVSAPWLLTLAITFWVAGFDVIYSIMDLDFDKQFGVKSIPTRFGVEKTIRISRGFHLGFIALLTASKAIYGDLLYGSTTAITIISFILLIAHRGLDVKRAETIKFFMNTNLAIGIIILLGLSADILLV